MGNLQIIKLIASMNREKSACIPFQNLNVAKNNNNNNNNNNTTPFYNLLPYKLIMCARS